MGLKQCTLHSSARDPLLSSTRSPSPSPTPHTPHPQCFLRHHSATLQPERESEQWMTCFYRNWKRGEDRLQMYEDCTQEREQDNPEARFTLHFTSAIQSCSTGHNRITSVTFTVQYECVTDDSFLYCVLYFLMLAQIKNVRLQDTSWNYTGDSLFLKASQRRAVLQVLSAEAFGMFSERLGLMQQVTKLMSSHADLAKVHLCVNNMLKGDICPRLEFCSFLRKSLPSALFFNWLWLCDGITVSVRGMSVVAVVLGSNQCSFCRQDQVSKESS